MFRQAYWVVGIVLVLGSVVKADIVVHEPNFVVDKFMDQIDGTTPRLEAITNPDYGFGVVAANIYPDSNSDTGILTVLKISQSSYETVAVVPGYPPQSIVGTVRFDKTGLFANQLFVSVFYDNDTGSNYNITDIIKIPSGEVVASKGNDSNGLAFNFDFTTGEFGYEAGAYLEDAHLLGGTSLYHMDSNFSLAQLSEDLLPEGRTDMDVKAIEFDPTGEYGNYLTMADYDENNDHLNGIYQLDPNLEWIELIEPVHTSTMAYRDMCFSDGGAFGQTLYVTDRVSETIMSVEPNGIHTVFASGFSGIEAVTVSQDSMHMFVSDTSGVYRIRAGTTEVGPQIVMREPWVKDDDVHTGITGVEDLRILWNEPVLFESSDISVVSEDGNDVPFSVSGSNSEFMIIIFGDILLHDKYTITIHDSVQSVETSAAIDGDNNGLAGGNAVLVMEHRQRHDSANDNDIDFLDFREFADKWLWSE